MWATTRAWALKFHASFHDSEVILFARIQVLFGIAWAILSVTDMAPLITNPKYLTAWLLGSGMVTEMLRRNRATDLDEPRPARDDHIHEDKK